MIFQETPSTKPRTNQQKPSGLVQGAGSHTCKDTYLERPAASFQVSARRGQLRAMRTSTLRRFLRRPPQKLENNPGRVHLRSGLTGRLRRGNYPLLCLGCEPAMGPHGLPATHPGLRPSSTGWGTPTSGLAVRPRAAPHTHLVTLLSLHQRGGVDGGLSTTGHVGGGVILPGACAGRSGTCGAGTLRRRH